MSSMPIGNTAGDSASGSQPAVDASGQPLSTPLPSAQELLDQVNAQQADAAVQTDATAETPAQATYTPTALDPRILTKAMSAYVKAQTQFIHDKDLAKYVGAMEAHSDVLAQFVHNKHLPTYAGVMEAHITEMTSALEQSGVL